MKVEAPAGALPPEIERELAKIVAASGHAAPDPALWVPRREAQVQESRAEEHGFVHGLMLGFVLGAVVALVVVTYADCVADVLKSCTVVATKEVAQ